MAKLAAIYSALDNGNPKSALRLCQQALGKSNSQLVRALMALAHSRLGQSSEALGICEGLEEEGVSDLTLAETIGYVYRREGRFDLLSRLFAKVSAEADSIDVSKQAFIAGVQSGHFDSLGALASRLLKLTNDKLYYAWAAFALYLKSSKGEDPKQLKLALAMLEKAESGFSSVPNENGESRNDTCARMHAYLTLFKLQILSQMGTWDDMRKILKSGMSAGLVTESEREVLLKDIDALQSSEPATAIESINGTETINSLEALVISNPEGFYSNFLKKLEEHISLSCGRSDCVVTTAPFLALVKKSSDIDQHLLALLSELGPEEDLKFLNIQKLLYGVNKEAIQVSVLIKRAIECIDREDDLDECSPGKQLLLLASIALLEQMDNDDVLFESLLVFDWGATKFKHCSHFRLVQCIVYTRLGLMTRGIERFEALGIKNAQWRNLFWLIEEPLQTFFTPLKTGLLEDTLDFFSRHHSDLVFAIASVVEQGTFFKYLDFAEEIKAGESSAVKAHASRELAFMAGSYISELTQSGNMEEEFDYSPLLFIAMPSINSETVSAFASRLKERRRFGPRACGFRWPLPEARVRVNRRVSVSNNHVLGRLIDRTNPQNCKDRLRIFQAVERVNKGEWSEAKSMLPDIEDDLGKIFKVVVGLVCSHKEGGSNSDPESMDDCRLIFKDSSNWRETLKNIGMSLTCKLQAVVSVCEKAAADLPKKSGGRKALKTIVTNLRTDIESVSAVVEKISLPLDSPLKVSVLDESLLERLEEPKFRAKLANDMSVEKSQIQVELQSLANRLKQIKF
jgi:hypothetical protein